MTLASVSADVALWCSVEREWMRALADLRIEEWHTADAIGRSPSSEFSSWKAGDFIKAFDRLASKALFQFRHAHLTANSCSIVMDDYHRFRRDHPDFKKKPEAICVDVCVGGVNYADVPMVGPDETVPFVGVFFDENERFERTIRRVWQDRKKSRRHNLSPNHHCQQRQLSIYPSRSDCRSDRLDGPSSQFTVPGGRQCCGCAEHAGFSLLVREALHEGL
jgi:hypothetical protein